MNRSCEGEVAEARSPDDEKPHDEHADEDEDEGHPQQRDDAFLFWPRLGDADGGVKHADESHERVEHEFLDTTKPPRTAESSAVGTLLLDLQPTMARVERTAAANSWSPV